MLLKFVHNVGNTPVTKEKKYGINLRNPNPDFQVKTHTVKATAAQIKIFQTVQAAQITEKCNIHYDGVFVYAVGQPRGLSIAHTHIHTCILTIQRGNITTITNSNNSRVTVTNNSFPAAM